MPERGVIIDVPSAEMGELLVQELTGLPVIWKPLGLDGRSEFDDHPCGEGYSLAELQRDTELKAGSPGFTQWRKDGNRGTVAEYLDWKRAGCFVRVRMSRADAAKWWREEDNPEIDAEARRDLLTGEMMLYPHRVATKRFRPESLLTLKDALKVAGQRCGNVLGASALVAPDAVVPVTHAEATVLRASLDTLRNSIITVGTGKTQATINGAITAASAGDCIEVYAGGVGNVYTETISLTTKALQLIGMIAEQGVTITQSFGIVINASGGARVKNFTAAATGTATDAIASATNPGNYISEIVGSGGTTSTFRVVSGGRATFDNCAAIGGAIGFSIGSQAADLRQCSAMGYSTAGFRGGAGNYLYALGCLGANNAVDFANAFAAGCACNVSEDATAPGGGSVTGFDDTDLEATWHLKAAVAGTTKALLNGYPYAVKDALGQTRKTGGLFFAGAHDPDPQKPDADYLLSGYTYDGVAGTFDESARNTDPGVANVRDGTTYKIQNADLEGTCAVPSYNYVQEDIPVDDTVGAFLVPSENDVEDGVLFGGWDAQYPPERKYEGNFEAPAEADVKDGVGYGSNGTEYTGALEISIPGTPIIGTVAQVGTAVTVPVTSVDTLCYVYLRDLDGTEIDSTTIAADGDAGLTLDATGKFVVVEARNKTSDSWGPSDQQTIFMPTASSVNEIAAGLLAILAADSALTSLLATSTAITRGEEPIASVFPCLTYVDSVEDEAALDHTTGSRILIFSISAWGFSEDVLHQILDALDDALYDTTFSTTAWEVVWMRRDGGSEIRMGGRYNSATDQWLHQMEATYRLVAHAK